MAPPPVARHVPATPPDRNRSREACSPAAADRTPQRPRRGENKTRGSEPPRLQFETEPTCRASLRVVLSGRPEGRLEGIAPKSDPVSNRPQSPRQVAALGSAR